MNRTEARKQPGLTDMQMRKRFMFHPPHRRKLLLRYLVITAFSIVVRSNYKEGTILTFQVFQVEGTLLSEVGNSELRALDEHSIC